MNSSIKYVLARYEHGRWIADCPHCNGAELARPGEDFLCGSHFAHEAAARRAHSPRINSKAISMERGQRYPVRFPAEKNQIEANLRQKDRALMHWRPTKQTNLEK